MNIEKHHKILITGATGFLGSYVARCLLHHGYQNIVCLKRKSSNMKFVTDFADQVEWAVADVLEISSLSDIVVDVDAIIHSAAMISLDPKDRSMLYRVNVEGTENLVNLALDNEIKKFVHVSSIAAIGRTGRVEIISEDTEWEDNPINSHYGISKFRAEMELWRAASEGLSMAIVNPSLILGTGNWNYGTPAILRRVESGLGFYPKGKIGIVDVRDVAEACVKLLESDIVNQRFIISAENISYKDVLFRIADALKVKRPAFMIPKILHTPGWIFEALVSKIMGRAPLITKESLKTTSIDTVFNNSKSVDKLGLKYRNMSDAVNEYCELYHQKEHIASVLKF